MAGRPNKEGLEYFPLDCRMDEKFELVESEHGIVGFGILIKLYQSIYANGYYLEWDLRQHLIYSNRINVDINTINDVINSAIGWGVFDKRLFDAFKILTSAGIQKRYFEITQRRKIINVYSEYLLIDLPNNVNINLINANINSINDNIYSQRESKSNIYNICNSNEGDVTKEQPVVSIPLISKNGSDQTQHHLYQKDITTYEKLYPNINVLLELNRCRQWNLDNPSRRKTPGGIKRHITYWLSSEEQKIASKPNNNTGYNPSNCVAVIDD
jgi:hypothetical protein